MTYVAHDESDFAPPMEVEEPELYFPQTKARAPAADLGCISYALQGT